MRPKVTATTPTTTPLLSILPLELWQKHILPTCSLEMSVISRDWRRVSFDLIFDDPRVDVCRDNNYPIRMAASLGYTHIVRQLLKCPKVDPLYWGDKDGMTALEWACQNGHVDTVRELLGSPVVQKQLLSGDGNIASTFNTFITKYLKDKVKGTHQRPDGPSESTVLLIAAELLANTADPWRIFTDLCARADLPCIVKVFLSLPTFDPSGHNNIVFLTACKHLRYQTVTLLLQDKRVDPREPDNTPIKVACEQGYHMLLEVLLGDPRIQNDDATYRSLMLYLHNVNYTPVIIRERLITWRRVMKSHQTQAKFELEADRLLYCTGIN